MLEVYNWKLTEEELNKILLLENVLADYRSKLLKNDSFSYFVKVIKGNKDGK